MVFTGVIYVIRDIRGGDLSFGFGRTKGWGRANSFEYTLNASLLPEPWTKYFKDNDFNLEELEKLHKQN